MIIRELNRSDLQELTPLFDGYRRFYKQESDREKAYRFLQERMLENDTVILGAFEDGHLVGFAQLFPSFSSVSMCKAWILNDLYVVGEKRGQGIGEALILYIFNYTTGNRISQSVFGDWC